MNLSHRRVGEVAGSAGMSRSIKSLTGRFPFFVPRSVSHRLRCPSTCRGHFTKNTIPLSTTLNERRPDRLDFPQLVLGLGRFLLGITQRVHFTFRGMCWGDSVTSWWWTICWSLSPELAVHLHDANGLRSFLKNRVETKKDLIICPDCYYFIFL